MARGASTAALTRLGAVLMYAVAMAYVEAAAVLYLRTIYGGVDPVGARHTPFNPMPDFGAIEIGREAATMVMLACVGWLAGRGTVGRFGAFVAAFGAWDAGYYLFLWLFAGWPTSLFAPDILFLIPLPWWGPVLSPVMLALLMVAAGSAALVGEASGVTGRPSGPGIVLVVGGGVLCLAAFMAAALEALPRGLDAAFATRGGPFPWPLYLAGFVVMAVGAALVVSRADPAPGS